jgi:hypothetical protein
VICSGFFIALSYIVRQYISGTAIIVQSETAYSSIEVKMQDQKSTEAQSMAGRKPEGNKSTHVRLDPEVMEKIDEIVGPGRRATFIRDAVDNFLKIADTLKRYRDRD